MGSGEDTNCNETLLDELQVDGSIEYEYTQQPTNAALPLANPQDFGPDFTAQQLQALIYNVLTQDTSQQGSALNTLQGLVASSPDVSLFLLNGDVCYARSAPRSPSFQVLPPGHVQTGRASLLPDREHVATVKCNTDTSSGE